MIRIPKYGYSVLRFSPDSLALRVKVVGQASQRNVLFTVNIDTITKSGRCHWETKALFIGKGTRKTWVLEAMPIGFHSRSGYWDTVSLPKLKEFPKLTTPMPSPAVASWTPLSGSTMDVPIRTQHGVPIVTFLTLNSPIFFPHTKHILEQLLVSASDHTQEGFTCQWSWAWCDMGVSFALLPPVGWWAHDTNRADRETLNKILETLWQDSCCSHRLSLMKNLAWDKEAHIGRSRHKR